MAKNNPAKSKQAQSGTSAKAPAAPLAAVDNQQAPAATETAHSHLVGSFTEEQTGAVEQVNALNTAGDDQMDAQVAADAAAEADAGRTFKYIGEHQRIDFYGIIFIFDQPQLVPHETVAYKWKKFGHGQNSASFTEITALVVDKLAGHPDFEEVE